MKKNLISVHDGDLRISSFDLSQQTNVPHRSIKILLKKYNSHFLEIGNIVLKYNNSNSEKSTKRGPKAQEVFLNETQSIFLMTLLKNNMQIAKFKLWLSKEFMKQRLMIATLAMNKRNSEWLSKRREGILERKEETDVIKQFIAYAQSQGSKSAEKYYIAFTKMENKSLFHIDFLETKFPNIREVVNAYCLDNLKMADRVIANTIKEGMGKNLPYKDVYQLCKERVEMYARAVGKVPIVKAIEECD